MAMNEDKTADGSDVVTLKKPEAHLKDSKLLSGKGNVPMARRSISDNSYHSLRGWNTGTRLTRAFMRDPSSALMRRSSTWETHHDDRISMAVVTSQMEIKGVWLVGVSDAGVTRLIRELAETDIIWPQA